MLPLSVRRAVRRTNRLYRETRVVGRALQSTRHPVLAHLVVIRKCNLACTYCSEFDNFSKPVATAELLQRIDHLAALGTTTITLTGGEPLLHPDIENVIRHIRTRGVMAILVTNGYFLNAEKINRLNAAGLDRMQISIDNVRPDDVSKKSLKVLDQRLRWLSEYAEFPVNIHSVVGACSDHPEDALTIARRARQLGLISSVGIVHDSGGQLQPLNTEQQQVVEDIEKLSKPLFSFTRHNPWRKNLARGLPNEWHCAAGGRHLYICENGLVHYCMSQRGYPAIPLAQYTQADIDREGKVKKGCTSYCTIFCIQRIAMVDELRDNPANALLKLFPGDGTPGAQPNLPVPIKLLTALFTPGRGSSYSRFFTRTASRILNLPQG